MSTTQPWIDGVLRKLQFRQNLPNTSRVENYRMMVERTQLVERMRATCQEVNNEAGETLILEDLFIQPQTLACRYVFERGDAEFTMSLAILSEGPTLLFSSTAPSLLDESIRRCIGHYIGRERDVVKFHLLVNPMNVSNADLQDWFTYLLSGLQTSFKPVPQKHAAAECN